MSIPNRLTSTVNQPLGCTHCGRQFARRSPRQRYCSTRCRVAGFRAAGERNDADDAKPENSIQNAVRPIFPKCVEKNPDKSRGLVTHQLRARSPAFGPEKRGICGPHGVIEAVFGGRRWLELVSPDCVAVKVRVRR